MRVYFNKTKFANQRKYWQPGLSGDCKFCQQNNINEPESLKHVLYECPDTKKCLELTLGVFGLPKVEEIKIKELILWKFINNEHNTRDYNKEVVFKTITTLFLCAYLKQRYSAATSNNINAQLIVDNIIQHLNNLNTCKPSCNVMRAIHGESLIERLLVSGFPPHKD